MQEKQEVTNFTQGAKFFLSAVEKVLRFRVVMNKMSGTQGRAAAIRELTAQQDIFTANKLARIVASWQQIPLEEQINYYLQTVNLITNIKDLEQLALDKLNKLTANIEPQDLPPFITMALTAHINLLTISSGLEAIAKSLDTKKPQAIEELSNILLNPANNANSIINLKIENQRRELIAKL